MFGTTEIVGAILGLYAVAYGLRWLLRRTGVTQAPEPPSSGDPATLDFQVLVVGSANDALLHAVMPLLPGGRPMVNMMGAPPSAVRSTTFYTGDGPAVRGVATRYHFCMVELAFLQLDVEGNLGVLKRPWDAVVVTSAVPARVVDAMASALGAGRPVLLRCPGEEAQDWAGLGRDVPQPGGEVGPSFVKALVRRTLERRRDA